MKSLPFLLIILVLLIVVSVIFIVVNPFKTMVNLNPFKKYQIKEIKEFSCPDMTGFTFSYPVFKDWEVKGVEKIGENECKIWLAWPSDLEFETPPVIYVTKMDELGLKGKELVPMSLAGSIDERNSDLGLKSTTPLKYNPNIVYYNYVYDPSLYEEDFILPSDHWDYLQFYGIDFGVRIQIEVGSEEHGFSGDAFVKKVIESFKFIENQILSAEADKCKLEVNVRQMDSTTLKVSYSFQNQSQRNAYLFNKIYHGITEDGVYTTDQNLLYTELEKGDVILSKKIIPVPADMEVEKPIIPCVTKVKPGNEFKETLLVTLPLKPWTPYFMPQDEDLVETPVEKQVFLEFGFFLAPPEGDALAEIVDTNDGTALCFYPFPVSSQKLMRVGPLSWTVPVLIPQ